MPTDRRRPVIDRKATGLIVWIFLGCYLLTLAITRGSDFGWPAIGWIMYSDIAQPNDRVFVTKIETETESGEHLWTHAADLMTAAERPFGKRVIESACTSGASADDYRRFLSVLLEHRWQRRDLTQVTCWEFRWDAASPVYRNRYPNVGPPDSKRALVSFRYSSMQP